MITYDDMPENNEELANIKIDFPHLDEEQNSRNKSFEDELLQYLDMEGENTSKKDLKFLRSGKIIETKLIFLKDVTLFWIWEFKDDSENKCYAEILKKNGQLSYGYKQDFYKLTPEQYILGSYHNVF